MFKIPMSKTFITKMKCLDHWRLRILDLPFDLAQGGDELVEPFRASKPGPRPQGGDSEGEFGISKIITDYWILSVFKVFIIPTFGLKRTEI